MAATGKTEIWLAIFAAASNDFMCEHHTPGSTGIDEEQPNDVPEEHTDGPKRRKQGKRRGKKKTCDIVKVVMEKEVQLSECLHILGPTEYHRRQTAILRLLTCKKENLKEKLAEEKVSRMIQKFDPNKESSLE